MIKDRIQSQGWSLLRAICNHAILFINIWMSFQNGICSFCLGRRAYADLIQPLGDLWNKNLKCIWTAHFSIVNLADEGMANGSFHAWFVFDVNMERWVKNTESANQYEFYIADKRSFWLFNWKNNKLTFSWERNWNGKIAKKWRRWRVSITFNNEEKIRGQKYLGHRQAK